MKLNSISARNLRSLKEVPPYTIPPLTLLVGANSSGKSTFIRLFPLLRQSVETVTRGPILWFGRFVDFGVFSDVVSRDAADPEIHFGFDLTLPQSTDPHRYGYWPPESMLSEETKVVVTLVVAEAAGTSNTYAKEMRLVVGEREVRLHANPDGTVDSILLDGKIFRSTSSELTLRSGASLFPVLVSERIKSGREQEAGLEWASVMSLGPFSDQLLSHVSHLFHKAAHDDKKAFLIARLGIGSPSLLLSQLKRFSSITPTSKERAGKEKAGSDWMKQLHSLVLLNRLPSLIGEIDHFLANVFRNVSYVGPLRATAERFYRQQDLAVDEVDPQGSNLAMYLMGLSASRRAKFSSWCEANIGLTVEAVAQGAHVSIRLRDSVDGSQFNIADMGFGYSQLLPVLATVWQAISSPPVQAPITPRMIRRHPSSFPIPTASPKIIAIEQPELHLHPRLQGRLASLLAAIVREGHDKSSSIHMICETHSETIINQIG